MPYSTVSSLAAISGRSFQFWSKDHCSQTSGFIRQNEDCSTQHYRLHWADLMCGWENHLPTLVKKVECVCLITRDYRHNTKLWRIKEQTNGQNWIVRALRVSMRHQTWKLSREEKCDQQLMEEIRNVCRIITGKLKEKRGGGGGMLVIYRQKCEDALQKSDARWTRFIRIGIGTRYRFLIARHRTFNKKYDIFWLPGKISASQGLSFCDVLPLDSTIFLFIVQEASSIKVGSQAECHTTRLFASSYVLACSWRQVTHFYLTVLLSIIGR